MWCYRRVFKGSSGRGLVHAVAWTLATGAAVTLSWVGVRTVLAGTMYDPPRALPLSHHAPSPRPATDPTVPPLTSSTHHPEPTPTATPSSAAPTRPAPSANPASPSAAPAARPVAGTAPAPRGTIKSYATAGGRVVFALDATSAQLVTATPDAGWRMQVWKQTGWIRVDFINGTSRTSVICTWNGHPPTVETDEHAT
ncbi:hypothetical protein [Streptomyces sp. NPDC003077]|uniref:hypothetical protein n=1 Tax=Streptomyces sp. NPDC003077 TaxID=3154443 RepID=UPI0033A9C2AA